MRLPRLLQLLILIFLGIVWLNVAHAEDPDLATITSRAATNNGSNRTRVGTIVGWSDDSISVRTEQSESVEIKDVQSITYDRQIRKAALPSSVSHSTPTSMILLSNGDKIVAQAIKVKGDILTIAWPALGSAAPPTIPLEKVTAVILDLPATMNERFRLFADLESAPAGSDVVMLANGDRSAGEFQSLDAAFIELKGPKSVLKIDRSRVRAIRMNPELTTKVKSVSHRTMLSLIDGSRLSATSVQSSENLLKLKTAGAGDVTIPLTSVISAQFFGEHAVPVSDYEPAKVEFTPYLSTPWSLMRNANVLHGPLTLRGKEYMTGLGMHSRMSVTYELRGNETTFQSVIGIDDAAKGMGNAVFTVAVDGQRVWTSGAISGQSLATTVPDIDLRGAKRLTLEVDFGQFADVSDYADWCDAIFILGPSKSSQ